MSIFGGILSGEGRIFAVVGRLHALVPQPHAGTPSSHVSTGHLIKEGVNHVVVLELQAQGGVVLADAFAVR